MSTQMTMDKEESNMAAKRCLDFDLKAPRKRRSKKSLKSFSRGLQMTSHTRGALQRLASRDQVSPIVEVSQEIGEDINQVEPNKQQLPKKHRGPTKMKTIATEEFDKVNITFNQFGQPIGEASVGLSSFLGPLVKGSAYDFK
ncbi:Plant transposase [Cucumis melo var. makuwa]|uniref:Plant transposase n=1 Tax=Cucumis melo var. makuwa TaxID=1194695 RepID=A0A5D3DEQ3_CUCMM|nr:Plant transposase [Cucumis melo var. makuwa]TYK22076.1 Plant transposase [Cucumis melo var. makuwa]